jgi:DNA invertase Pin-like site-specific DNA recombinase
MGSQQSRQLSGKRTIYAFKSGILFKAAPDNIVMGQDADEQALLFIAMLERYIPQAVVEKICEYLGCTVSTILDTGKEIDTHPKVTGRKGKLEKHVVQEIFKLQDEEDVTQAQVASMFGIHYTTVGRIWNEEIYKRFLS